MAKTIKEIADELGVDKQKVYRFIKQNQISEVLQKAHHEALQKAHQKNGVMYFDEAAEKLIKRGFSVKKTYKKKDSVSEAHHDVLHDVAKNSVNEALVDMLRKELEIKNKQIEDLNARLAECSAALLAAQDTAHAAQALHAGTIQQHINRDEPPREKGRWFHKFFRK